MLLRRRFQSSTTLTLALFGALVAALAGAAPAVATSPVATA
jgi:hypothetical protein